MAVPMWPQRTALAQIALLGGTSCYLSLGFFFSLTSYHNFQTIRHTPLQIWNENGGASYSPNVAYLAGGVEGVLVVERDFVSYFRPLKPRHVLWSGGSYGLKNAVVFLS